MLTRNGLITLGAMGMTTLAAYAFQTVMARLLSTVDFGELSTIVATLNIVTIPIFGLGMAITRQIAATRGLSAAHAAVVIRPFVTRVAAITVAVVAAIGLANGWLGAFLQLSSATPLIFLALLVAMTNVVGTGRSVLLGLHDFAWAALNQVGEALVRLAAGIAIALAGLTSAAGFGGYSAGLCAALLLVVWRVPLGAIVALPWPTAARQSAPGAIHNAEHHPDITWPAVIVSGATIVLLNMDLVAVKHFLPPEDAGQYAVISVLARGLFVITNAFDIVLFPAAASARASGVGGGSHLKRAIGSAAALILPILAIYWVAPAPLVGVVFGSRYVAVAPLLGPLGVAITLVAVATLLARYTLAVGRQVPLAALVAVVAAAAGGFLVFHDSLSQIVGVLLLASVVALAVCGSGALIGRRERV